MMEPETRAKEDDTDSVDIFSLGDGNEAINEAVLDSTLSTTQPANTAINSNTCCIFKQESLCCHKIVLVLLMCSIAVPSYFIMELPAGLERAIIEVTKLSTTEYNLLYSLFFWPTIFLAPVGGIIIDKFRTERCLPVFLSLCCLGQAIWTIGGFTNNYWIMLLGRITAGAGGQMVFISLASYVAICFVGNVTLINGLILGAGRLGATLSVNLNSLLYERFSYFSNHQFRIGCVLLTSVAIISIAFVSSLLLWLVFARAKYPAVKSVKFKFLQSCNSCFKQRKCSLHRCPSLYYLLLISVAGIFYSAVLSPVSIGELYYMQKFGISLTVANIINSLVNFLPIFLCPLFGILIDYIGYNPLWILVSVLIGSFSHLLLAYSGESPINAYIGSITGGLSYSLFTTSNWPMISLITRPEVLGISYGVQGTVISSCQVLVGLTVGITADTVGYFMVQLYYVALSLLALSLVTLLNVIDVTGLGNKRANVSGRKRRKALRESSAKSQ